jgi:hypothetical protein
MPGEGIEVVAFCQPLYFFGRDPQVFEGRRRLFPEPCGFLLVTDRQVEFADEFAELVGADGVTVLVVPVHDLFLPGTQVWSFSHVCIVGKVSQPRGECPRIEASSYRPVFCVPPFCGRASRTQFLSEGEFHVFEYNVRGRCVHSFPDGGGCTGCAR